MKKIFLTLLLLLAFSSVTFAFDENDAMNKTLQMYPKAMIMDVSRTEIKGVSAIVVIFHSMEIEHGTTAFDIKSGKCIVDDVKKTALKKFFHGMKMLNGLE